MVACRHVNVEKEAFLCVVVNMIIGKYLETLETIKVDWPVTMLPMQGASVSAKGPTGEYTMHYYS